jgi:hypothetical protein
MPFVTQIFSQIWARTLRLGAIVILSFSEISTKFTYVAQSSTDSGFSYKTINYDHRLMLFS